MCIAFDLEDTRIEWRLEIAGTTAAAFCRMVELRPFVSRPKKKGKKLFGRSHRKVVQVLESHHDCNAPDPLGFKTAAGGV
jgi:hypothetical protein